MKWRHTSYKAQCLTCALDIPRLDRRRAEQAALDHIREMRGQTIADCDVMVIRSRHEELSRVSTWSVA